MLFRSFLIIAGGVGIVAGIGGTIASQEIIKKNKNKNNTNTEEKSEE